MPQTIQRTNNLPGYPITCSTTVGNSTTISMGAASSMAVLFTDSFVGGNRVDWFGALAPEGPYLPVFLAGGELAYTTITDAGLYVTPPDLFACAYLRGVAESETTGTVLLKG